MYSLSYFSNARPITEQYQRQIFETNQRFTKQDNPYIYKTQNMPLELLDKTQPRNPDIENYISKPSPEKKDPSDYMDI